MGSGKTALVRQLCIRFRDEYNIACVTNDIFTREDAEFLLRNNVSDLASAYLARAVSCDGSLTTAFRACLSASAGCCRCCPRIVWQQWRQVDARMQLSARTYLPISQHARS